MIIKYEALSPMLYSALSPQHYVFLSPQHLVLYFGGQVFKFSVLAVLSF